VLVSAEMLGEMEKQAKDLGQKRIINLIELFTSTEREMKWTSQPRLILELGVIKASNKSLSVDYEELVDRVAQLESMVSQMADGAVASPGQGHQKPGTQKIKPHPRGRGKREANEDVQLNKFNSTVEEVPVNTGQIKQDIDAATLRKFWPDILERIKKVQMSARAFLIEGKPVDISNGHLVLCFSEEYGFHKEKVEQPNTKNAIEQVVKEVTGADLKLQCKFARELDVDSSEEVSAANDTGLVEKAIGVFGEKFIEIKE